MTIATTPPGPAGEPGRLAVIYRDDWLLIVDKPSGLVVHRGWANDAVVAVDLLRELAGQPVYPLHRLDRGTSGVLVVALDATTARVMQPAFHDGRLRKRYLALVRGPAPEACVVDHPIPNKPGGPRVPAVTEVRRLGRFERYSLVEAWPRTGRLHQVRRHLKHLSLPVIGDANYGKSEHTRQLKERFGLSRLALHASEITLDHPTGGQRLRLGAPLPADLWEPFEKMGLSEAATLPPSPAPDDPRPA